MNGVSWSGEAGRSTYLAATHACDPCLQARAAREAASHSQCVLHTCTTCHNIVVDPFFVVKTGSKKMEASPAPAAPAPAPWVERAETVLGWQTPAGAPLTNGCTSTSSSTLEPCRAGPRRRRSPTAASPCAGIPQQPPSCASSELQATMQSLGRALDIKQRVLGWRHVEVAQLLARMAEVAQQQGDFQKALGLWTRALPAMQDSLGSSHADVGVVLCGMGVAQEKLGLLSEAGTSHERALTALAAAHGSHHNSVASTLASLANVRQLQGRFAEAADAFEQALSLKQACLGDAHEEVAEALCSYATMRLRQGLTREAVALYERALSIQEGCHGSQSAEVAIVLGHLGRCLAKGGQLKEADAAYSRAVAIKSATLGPDHPETMLTQSHLTNLRALPALRLGWATDTALVGATGCATPRTAAPAVAERQTMSRESMNEFGETAESWPPGVAAPAMRATPIEATPVERSMAMANGRAAEPPSSEGSLASRLAAQRQARSAARAGRRRVKQRAPSRPVGQPAVSMIAALEKQTSEDEAARQELLDRFWSAQERG